jgi:4-amino-4-deoxy-L-arabinose transferase-like glycosyltransferase
MSRPRLALVALALCVALGTALLTRLVVVAADEVIYVVGARNLIERGTLNATFYLPYSLIVQGYPHHDVHMPGYVFALAPFVAVFGSGVLAPGLLNVLLLVAMVLLVHAVALRLLGEPRQALIAAALASVLPPYPGYLYVAFPEFALPVLLLACLCLALDARQAWRAVLAGVLFGLGPLFRENLLIALPILVVALPWRLLLVAFLPAALATATATYLAFGAGRAQLPNSVYPGILFESLRSSEPFTHFGEALLANIERNLALLRDARPFAAPEDAVLLFLLLLGCTATVGALQLRDRPLRVGLAIVASFALVFTAVVAAYALRATGRPWAGVRQFMAWQPLLLVLAVGAVWSLGRARLAALVAAAAVCVGASLWHIDFVNGVWKGRDLRDSERFIRDVAPWVDPTQPRRIAARSNHAFLYGLTRFPVEVIWPIRSVEELKAVEGALGFDFLVVPGGWAADEYLDGNARYGRVDPPGGRFDVWRRFY